MGAYSTNPFTINEKLHHKAKAYAADAAYEKNSQINDMGVYFPINKGLQFQATSGQTQIMGNSKEHKGNIIPKEGKKCHLAPKMVL